MTNSEELIGKVEKLLKLIEDENYKSITGYKVSKETGVHAVTISKLKNKQAKIENLSMSTFFALYNYVVKLEEEQDI
ncbi:hypothetical protein [Staphylococcus aureus]|uniref:hypothetical protein n=1 Tax=Staphylococcus aureus TaxID=1280 RepID=UPI0012488694|nr:hypothetical protein [Staphylococcus aureus]